MFNLSHLISKVRYLYNDTMGLGRHVQLLRTITLKLGFSYNDERGPDQHAQQARAPLSDRNPYLACQSLLNHSLFLEFL